MYKNIVNFIGCDGKYEDSGIVLFGAPFDSTTSFRPGTRFAGQSVRNDSYGLEIYSPYQDRELPEDVVYDCGDLELAIGSSEAVLGQIEECAGQILKDGKSPADIPVGFAAEDDMKYVVNEDMAATLGVTIPDKLK